MIEKYKASVIDMYILEEVPCDRLEAKEAEYFLKLKPLYSTRIPKTNPARVKQQFKEQHARYHAKHREEQNRKQRERGKKRRANWTKEEHEARKKQMRDYYRKTRSLIS